MTAGRPLTGLDIRALVGGVADALDPNGEPRYTVVLVGGSLLAWRGLRASTADVDSVRPIAEELAAAVVSVAHAHDLASDWLTPMRPRSSPRRSTPTRANSSSTLPGWSFLAPLSAMCSS